MKKALPKNNTSYFLYIFLTSIVLILSFILYFKQTSFTTQYDGSYWKDRFERSQWALPLSKRDMGDDGIYAYGGYQLMNGASIEETNTNKPPVGIYLLGLSIKFFNNPNIIILAVGILTLITFYFIAIEFLKDIKLAVGTVALLAVNSMFYSHLWLSLLDLIQLFFFLLHFLFFIYLIKYPGRRTVFAVLTGLTLGLFTETKPPILLPLILLFEVSYLFYKKLFKEIIIVGVFFTIGIFLPYFRYFQNGNSIIDYLKLHKYMASVYYEGTNTVHRLSMLQTIFIGKFPDVSTGALTKFGDWSYLVPVVFLVGIFSSIKSILNKKEDIFLKGISLFILLTLFLYSSVSSYPRYLLIILPFVTLLFTVFINNYIKGFIKYIIISLLLLISLVTSYKQLIPDPFAQIDRFYYNYDNLYFQDIYEENITPDIRQELSRDEFRKISMSALNDATIRSTKFKELRRNISQSNGLATINLVATYHTAYLGSFSEEKVITLKKSQGVWRVVWDWDLIFNNYNPGNKFEKNTEFGKRGSIIDASGNFLATDDLGYLISITPSKIDLTREREMLKDIYLLTGAEIIGRDEGTMPAFHNAYTENILPNTTIPIATNFRKLTAAEIDRLRSYPGITLIEHPARIYSGLDPEGLQNATFDECCTRIYTVVNYHGVTGVEKEYDTTLSGHNGGSIEMLSPSGEVIRKLVDKKVKNGEDMTIDK